MGPLRPNTGKLDVIYRLDSVSKIYHPVKSDDPSASTTALSNISFDVEAGEILVIMGESGSGKSTLLHILGGLDLPTKGNVYLSRPGEFAAPQHHSIQPSQGTNDQKNESITNQLRRSDPGIIKKKVQQSNRLFTKLKNRNIRDARDSGFENRVLLNHMNENQRARLRNADIGVIYQAFHLIPTLQAWENIALPLVFKGVSFSERKERAFELLKDLELLERAHHYPNQMSGGEQQRAAIARALITDARILLADEPTGNLDSKSEKKVLDSIKKLHEDRRLTTILVTHNEKIAKETADRILCLKDGNISGNFINNKKLNDLSEWNEWLKNQICFEWW